MRAFTAFVDSAEPHRINADLHCHSLMSDGTHEPEELAARAKAGGVVLWALTDHDELSGVKRARAAAQKEGIGFLSGVEISVTFANKTVHIVGLGVDEDDATLMQGLRVTCEGRTQRAQAMSEDLAKARITGAYEGAMQFVSNPALISRTHFARYLIKAGHCQTMGEAFARYLTQGKPGYAPHRWASLRDAVQWIVGAGGQAVIAHPGRYTLGDTLEYALFTDFKNFGGCGVEVITGSHTPRDFETYAHWAKTFGLCASRGSDFHSDKESRCALGTLPDLPAHLKPIWTVLQDRIS